MKTKAERETLTVEGYWRKDVFHCTARSLSAALKGNAAASWKTRKGRSQGLDKGKRLSTGILLNFENRFFVFSTYLYRLAQASAAGDWLSWEFDFEAGTLTLTNGPTRSTLKSVWGGWRTDVKVKKEYALELAGRKIQ